MALQKEGVLLAIEGANQFLAQMRSATNEYEKFISSLAKGESAASGMGGSMGTLGGLASKAGAAVSGMSTAVFAVGAAAVGAVAGIVALGKGMMNLAKATAPIEGLQTQFANLTAGIEGGTSAMLFALQRGSTGMIANRDLMQQFNNAASLVNVQFAQRLPEALNLLGKVSAATGTDMKYLMDSLVIGVGRVSPMILDNLKIQVGVAEATDAAAKMFGKEADALTKVEQQTALTDLVLAKLQEKYGALPDTTQTAAAQMARFGAHLQNIKDTLGQFLLPAFAQFMDGLNEIVGAFSMAISEGGAFYPILVNLGAALSILADGFHWLASRAGEFLADLQSDWTTNIGGMAQDAIQWGAEIVTNFAVGMIDAANTVLTWAMQQIGNILMFWLAPGSPPKVAPNLDKWGMSAFESYLQGMTKADFGVLESVQGPLKKLLSGPQFADASKAIAGALAGGDREGALAILSKSSKHFGDDVAELARREFALADATQAVTDAENALLMAQERAARANRQVSAETAKYNEMLREGASKEILDAQLARINAAEAEAVAARQAETMAGTGIEDAKTRVDTLKEEVDWQSRFLDQLFGINDALTQEQQAEQRIAAERAATAGKGTGGAALPEVVAPTGPAGGIGGAIAGAIEAAKQRIKESLGGIWDTIKTEFSDKWDKAIGELGKTWEKFKETVGKAWDDLKEKWPFLQDVETWIVGLPEKITTMITDGWDKFKTVIDAVWEFIKTYLLPIFKDLKTLGLLVVEVALISLQEKFTTWLGEVQKVWTWLKETFLPFIEGPVTKIFTYFRDELIAKLTAGIELFKANLIQAKQALEWLIEKFQDWIKIKRGTGIATESPESPLSKGVRLASEQMERMARVSIPMMNQAMAFQPAGVGRFTQAAGTTYNRSSSITVGPNNISSGMDESRLEALIRRVMIRELR